MADPQTPNAPGSPYSSTSSHSVTSGSSPSQMGGRARSADEGGPGARGNGIINRVKRTATAQLSAQKDKATQGLGSVAQAVRQSTQHLRDQKHETVAGYVDQAADQIEKLSERLRKKDVGELVQDTQRFARRQPAAFLGSAFALGLIGARFLKSSSPDDTDQSGYNTGEDWPRDRTAYSSSEVSYGNADVYGRSIQSSTPTPTAGSVASPRTPQSTAPSSPSRAGSGASSRTPTPRGESERS